MKKYLLAEKETQRLRFEETGSQFYAQWRDFMSDPRAHLHWNEPDIPAQIKMKEWFEKQVHRYSKDLGGMNALIEIETGRFVGHAGLLVQTVDEITELEVGYSLLPEFWGKGYATEAALACRNFAFSNNFSESLISIIAVTNEPSMQVARRNGMEIDKHTVYQDNPVTIFRINRSKWEGLVKK